MQPFTHFLQNRACSQLPLTSSQLCALPSDLRFHRIDPGNPLQRLMRQGSRYKILLLVDFEVFSSRVSPACSFYDAAINEDRVVAGERINLQHPAERAQVLPGMFSPAVFGMQLGCPP